MNKTSLPCGNRGSAPDHGGAAWLWAATVNLTTAWRRLETPLFRAAATLRPSPVPTQGGQQTGGSAIGRIRNKGDRKTKRLGGSVNDGYNDDYFGSKPKRALIASPSDVIEADA